MQATYPLGALIRPNDKELLQLLVEKILGYDDPRIPVININDCEPWELPQFLGVDSSDREWYFFRRRQERNHRTTKAGYYKVTGKGIKIKDRQEEIGTKTFLVYYKGRTPKGVITGWKMHEINATCLPEHQRSFILCKLIDRSDNESYLPNYNEGEQVSNMVGSDSYQMTNYSTFNAGETSWSENQATDNGIPQQEATELAPYPESFHCWTGQNCTSNNWLLPPEAEQGLFYDNFGSSMFPPEASQFYGNTN
ncbi:hypothetical protein P3X46_005743 [Hevea brasiliensis]|uniref:NAC domain-containing protein n=1 Tax=Hevea brasiliensis TaxID=3981 RepID=A0ABQ9N3I8_HEVBR|nr:NAC domain-containing protein 69 [Hevea brasiliensis]XP_021674963.2 NAC domain-containing protein 69 [Hevea brasiliensis]KAJ9186215.1 hypothetical protein P3X46_005743 [Hevea brasiliensis]